MKKFSLFLGLIMLLSACDQLKNLADVTFDADFAADIPLVTPAVANGEIGADEYPLGGSYTLKADDNEEVAEYIDLLKEISLTGYTMKPIGLSVDAVLSSLKIMINDVVLFEGTNIMSTSVYDESDVSQAAIDEFTKSMLDDKMVTFTVTGSSNQPVFVTISQLFETEITANPLD